MKVFGIKMTVLPPRMERALVEWAERAAFQVMLRTEGWQKTATTKNGTWAGGAEFENIAAYEAVKKDVWMYASIYAIASSAASLPFGEYKRKVSTKGGDYELNEDGVVTNIFEKPNSIQTKSEFMEAIFWSLELTGKLFLQCLPNKTNPTEMFVLDPRRTKPVRDDKKPNVYATHYEIDINGQPVKIPLDQIIFHRYHDPADAHDGLSASTPAGDAINCNILSSQYNNEYFANSAIPAATLEVERRLNDAECDLIRQQWEKQYKGRGKRHRTAILFGGVKFVAIQKSPKDMEFIKQKALSREETLASYGVPPVMVGLLESVNYGNSKEQRKIFWQQSMRPKLKSFAERMTLEFGLDGFKRRAAFDLSDVEALQEDQEIKSRIAFNLTKGMVMVPDEIRRILYKMPPLQGGAGQELWVPSNMTPARLLVNGPIAMPSSPSGKPGKPGGPDADSPPEEGGKPGANDGKPAGKAWTDEELAVLDKLLRKMAESASGGIEEITEQVLV